ncbi:MAG TPA: translocation/assembly module TamB domain-containing protein [Vicinamibacterales bacterium]|jgi:hypothetical protein|nr:translocation/assembly module TamB domain-containing protein [Vicinamibacterales bacterium]
MLRRTLRVIALIGTLIVGAIALALIVSQTDWFRDWARRMIVRQANQYLNGELAIGRLRGNLFFGAELDDLSLHSGGEQVVAVKTLSVNYSVLDLVSKGLMVEEIRLEAPRVRVTRTADGWNLGRLVKEERREADREGPMRPVSIGSIGVSNGDIVLEGARTAGTFEAPRRLRDLNAQMSFEYAPVHYTVTLDRLSFTAASPNGALHEMSGKIAVRDDNLFLDDLTIRTAESDLFVDGVIEHYLRRPVIKLVTRSRSLSLPEVGRFLPAIAGINLRPSFEIETNGPVDRLGVTLDVRSAAGQADGSVTLDLEGPRRAVGGTVNVRDFNLGPLTGRRDLGSHITGRTTFDLVLPPGGVDAIAGPFTFAGPRVTFAGYEAERLQVKGRLDGPRIVVDGRTHAYGAASSVRGTIVRPGTNRTLAMDLRGSASNVDLRRLPRRLNVPRLDTVLAADWHFQQASGVMSGDAVLGASRIEGADVASGTTATFRMEGNDVEYAAKGAVTRLDLQRVGKALNVSALAADRFGSSLSGPFDVKGSGKTVDELRIDASGELVDSQFLGGELPRLRYTALLDRGALTATAAGSFAQFDPAALMGRTELKGTVTGQLDVQVALDDVRGSITPETLAAAGRVELSQSSIGGIDVEKGLVDGRIDRGNGEIRTLDVSGADLHVTASGAVALTDTGSSSVKYHIDTPSLEAVGELVGQPLQGAVTLDGQLTGNRASLETTGTFSGSNVKYGETGALDANSQYSVRIPDLSFKDATFGATTTATFVRVAGLELGEVEGKTTYKSQTLEFDGKVNDGGREAAASGTLLIHADHNELHLPTLTLRAEGLEWRMAGTNAVVQFDAREIRVKNVQLVGPPTPLAPGTQSLAVEGTIARGAETTGDLRVKASNVDVAQLEKLLVQDRGVAGLLSADVRLTGSLDSPRAEGSVALNQGRVRTFAFESLTANVDYTGGGVQVDARLQQTAQHWLTAKGYAPMTLFRFEPTARAEHVDPSDIDRVDLRIESSPIDLGIVQGFTTQVVDVAGTLTANLHVGGSGRDPHVEGVVTVSGGSFKVPAGGVTYTGLDTRIDLHPDRVVVSGFEVRDDGGDPLLVSGELAVHEGSVGAVNLQLQADSFEIVDNELGDIEVDSRLRITGELRRPRVEGEIKLHAGRIEVDQVLATLATGPYATEATAAPLVEPGVRVAASSGGAREATALSLEAAAAGVAPIAPVDPLPPEEPPGVFNQLALDVRIQIPDNLVLRGADLRPGGRRGLALGDINMTVGGDLRVRKQPGSQVTLLGTINTVRGFYQFQGRRFDVTRDGRVRFTGLPEINPLLDVTAERDISGVIARVHVRGTARRPELTLSSTPTLDQADILSLIVFNQPINNLDSGERVALAQRAGAIASGFVTAPLAESIGRALDLDLFEIETTGEAAGFGASVTLGQQVSEQLFLKFRQHFGAQDASEFILEYQIARFLRLQGSGAPGATTKTNRSLQRRVERGSADLIFFFSY